ncbi:MAG TPA: hypothetical protein VMU87_04675 [Stellaceae bacterium]|nr:hypothetical protein [Stellaceae bacterium]
MSDSDILAVQLWIGAAAIAVLAMAMAAAGWKHKYFIRGLFALVGLLALVAIFWREIMPIIPDAAGGFVASLANSRLAWFITFVCGTGTIWFIAKMRARKPELENPGNDAWEDNMPLMKIYNRKFVNETVSLDGRHFVNPVFDNVTLFYQGTGPVFMENPTYILHDGKMKSRFASRNKVITMAIKIHDNLLKAASVQTTLMTLGPEATFDAPKVERDPH